MSFGESMFSVGFNQKTAKEDLFVKGNHGMPPRNQRGKTLEDSRRLSTEARHMSLVGPTCHPLGVYFDDVASGVLWNLLE